MERDENNKIVEVIAQSVLDGSASVRKSRERATGTLGLSYSEEAAAHHVHSGVPNSLGD